MPRPLFIFLFATLLLTSLPAITAVRAATELQWINGTNADTPLAWVDWADRTIAVTTGGIRDLDWSLDEGMRSVDLLVASLDEARLTVWGDSVFVDQLGLPATYLIALSSGNNIVMHLKPTAWHLPNTRLEGQDRYVDLGDHEVVVYPAPGDGPAVGSVMLAGEVSVPDGSVVSGDRAAVVKRLDDQAWIQIFDLATPSAPIAGMVLTRSEPTWIALHGRTLVVADHLLYTYDVSDIDDPVLLGTLGPAGQYQEPVFRDDGLLAVWRNRDLRLVDAADPMDLRPGATLPAVLPEGEQPWPLYLGEDRLVTRGDHGLQSYTMLSGHYVLLDGGVGWWRVEGSLAASDGQQVYVQGDRRYVYDLQGNAGFIELLGAVDSPAPGSNAFLGLAGDYLVYADGGGQAVIEDVSDPLTPLLLATIAPATPVRALGLDGSLLVVAREGAVEVHDLGLLPINEPVGSFTDISRATDVVVQGGIACVLEEELGVDDRILLIDLGDPTQPVLAATCELNADGWQHSVMQMTRCGNDLLAQAYRQLDGQVEVYTLRIDLADPAAPVTETFFATNYFWGDWSQPPVEIVGFHVAVEVGNLFLYDYVDDPVNMPILDILQLPARIRAVTTSGNSLVALYDRQLARCTVSAVPPVAAPTLVPRAATAARAVPNPFNPRTEITFSLERAGPVEVAVFDLRGREVRTLRAELPAGSASLTWDGHDDAGRALPSGTYLLRVTTPGAVHTGRCALVR